MAVDQSHRSQYQQWVRDFAPELYRYAYRLSGNRQVAEDILQDTFMEAWRSLLKCHEVQKPRPWLFQILRFRNAHYRRDTRHHNQAMSLTENTEDHPPQATRPALDTLADRDALQLALDGLSPIIRETFLMVFGEGRTCRETAESLRIPLGTVLSRLDSGRKALRAAMQEQPDRIARSGAGTGMRQAL